MAGKSNLDGNNALYTKNKEKTNERKLHNNERS
jgi:hypothetical protein